MATLLVIAVVSATIAGVFFMVRRRQIQKAHDRFRKTYGKDWGC